MKRWIFILGLILLITGNSWGVQTTDFLNEHVVCIDSIPGTQGECDSAHIWTLFGNADYPCYVARTTDCGGSWIDSVDYAGKLHASYRFFDQVADCDCDSGAGSYTVIVTLYGSGVPTENSFKFELTDSSFNNALTRVGQINEDTKNLTFTGTDVKATLDGETVTVGTNNDKEGYKLAADGLDVDTSFSNVQTHIVKDSTNIEAVKAKTDDLTFTSSHVHSAPKTDVTVGIGSIVAIVHLNYDTMYFHRADFHSEGDTNTNPFQAGADNVFLSGNYAQIANDNYDTMFVHKTDFHSTGFASPSDVRTQCADAFSDSGYTLSRAGNLDNLDEAISGLDDNPWNNALTDTASGMGDWFADYFNAIFGPKFDSLVQAVADANKANFKADVSGVSTFDASTDSTMPKTSIPVFVTGTPDFYNWTDAQRDSLLTAILDANKVNYMRWTAAEVGSLLNTVEDANKVNFMRWTAAEVGSLLNTVEDANKANFKADVSGLSTHDASDVWEEDTGGVALTKYGGAVLDYDNYKGSGADLSDEVDSLLAVIYDRANDSSFVRIISQYVLKHLYPDSVTIDNSDAWDLSGGTDLSDEVDSLLAALYDRTNDTAFVQIISQYVLKHLYPDSVTIDNSNAWDLVGAGGVDLSDEVDSLLSAIYDRANDTSFVRIISQYVLLRLHPDSLRAFLATHDSTLLELAAACGSGTGTRTVTITVKNAADSVAISGFEIAVYDSSSGEPQANGTTNSNGVFTCSLDDETYTVHITNPPWSLTSPRRFVITANMDSTFYATPFTPGSPPADSLCVVWGRVKDKHGDPYVGAKVSIWMDAYPVTFAGILIDVATKSVVYTDTLGVFEFSDGIYYSSSLNPSNLKWKVRVKTKNAEWIWEGMVAVPSQASWEIEIPDL